MTLFEISTDLRALLEAIAEGDIPEEAADDTLENLQLLLEDKIEGCACYLKELASNVETLKAEEAKLAARRKTAEKAQEHFKQYVISCMTSLGMTKYKSPLNSISIRHTKKAEVTDESQIPAEFLKEKVTVTVDKTALLTALKEGRKVPGAFLNEEGWSFTHK